MAAVKSLLYVSFFYFLRFFIEVIISVSVTFTHWVPVGSANIVFITL